MDLVAIESRTGSNSQDFRFLTGENYEIMLKESIHRFLDEFQKGNSDFSGFGSIFFRLLQATTDPSLETIWFYSAVSFLSSSLTECEPLNRVSMARDLFQMLVACSASCNGVKSIAVIAPVLCELHCSVVGLSEKKLSLKMEKKVMREIECLTEGITSYISICCSKDCEEKDALVGLLPFMTDLIRLWTVDRLEGKNPEVNEYLKVFFPLISDEIREGLRGGECVVRYLAGVVIVETFLLRLCLKFRAGYSRSELQKELRTWAVGSITGFQNCYFFEILVRMLLEPTLPVTSLLDPLMLWHGKISSCRNIQPSIHALRYEMGSEDEVILRKVLYEVVILVEYSFLNPERGLLPTDRMKKLAVMRLILVHEAIQDVRSNGDQNKAISFINAFSRSFLPSELINWVTNRIGLEKKPSKPNASTPHSLIKWLLYLEDQGVRIFDHSISKLRSKLVLDMSKVEHESPVFKPSSKKVDGDLFYIDNKGGDENKDEGDQEMVESMDAAFLAAAHMMQFTANDGRRKRKEERKAEGETQVKFLKYQLHDGSLREKLSPSRSDDGLNSGSEVENPLSDEDMEEVE